ncbi:MAG: YidC/Oxa1 family membrane protein insertase [Candidatus Paceibacterota bacterium]
MLHYLWDTVLYHPFVNLLAFIVSVVPGGDLGIAIIILTILVKIALYPLSQRSIESQAKMNLLAPEINKIKQSGGSKEEQAKMTFELYKKHKTNPFSGCFLVLMQIPIIFALYYVFYTGISFDTGILYSFVPVPGELNTMFLGIIDVAGKSIVLAILAGVSQYFQARYMPKPPTPDSSMSDFAASFQKSMHMQMKYFFPIIVAFISYTISGAIALYWIVNNVFSIGQQLYANRKNSLVKSVKAEIKE